MAFAQKPIEGVSMLDSFDDAQAKSAHTVQYYEIYGNRGIYKDGWYATTLHKVAWEAKPRSSYADDKWELYNTAEDFSCANDLAAKYPDKLKEMQAAFMAEAIKYNVLPLDDRAQERFNATLAGRPDFMGGRTSLTLYPGHGRDEGERLHRREEPEFLDHRRPRDTAERCLGRHPRTRWRALRLEPLRQGRQAHVCLQLPGRRDDHRFQGAPARRPCHRHLRFRLRRAASPARAAPGRSRSTGKRSAPADSSAPFRSSTALETADVGMDLYTAVTADYAKATTSSPERSRRSR